MIEYFEVVYDTTMIDIVLSMGKTRKKKLKGNYKKGKNKILDTGNSRYYIKRVR